MRLFGSDRIAPLMEKLGMQEGEVIESGLVSYQIENAQRRVETQNFDIRKQLLDYDNVMNKQREVIYKLRDEVLFGASVSAQAKAMIEEDAAEAVAVAAAGRDDAHDWDIPSLSAYLERAFGLQWTPSEADLSRLSAQSLTKDLVAAALEAFDAPLHDEKEDGAQNGDGAPSQQRGMEIIMFRVARVRFERDRCVG